MLVTVICNILMILVHKYFLSSFISYLSLAMENPSPIIYHLLSWKAYFPRTILGLCELLPFIIASYCLLDHSYLSVVCQMISFSMTHLIIHVVANCKVSSCPIVELYPAYILPLFINFSVLDIWIATISLPMLNYKTVLLII